MSKDTIYRQDAIDALHKKRIETMKKGQDVNLIWECLDLIAQVSPAQPKAIRPKFVAEDRFIKNHFYMYPHCPKCDHDLETGDCYCRVCGCHIDWSEDDE